MFYTTLTTNHQILPRDDEDSTISLDIVVLKTKGHKKTLQQQESAVAYVATTETAMVAQDTKQIEVPYCTYCNKPYHNVRKCYMLYPELKPKNTGLKKRKLRRQKAETGNESDSSVGLIAHFGMAATSDEGSLLYT